MAETNIAYINRKVHRPWLILLLRLTIIGAVFLGVFRTTGGAWALGDVGVGLMAWLNLVAIVILQKPALAALRDYQRQRKARWPTTISTRWRWASATRTTGSSARPGWNPTCRSPERATVDLVARVRPKAAPGGRSTRRVPDALRLSGLRSFPDFRFPIPGYFGASRTAPSRRIVSPLM